MHEPEQLRHELLAVTEILQRIGSSRDVLTVLSPEAQIALINAAGDVFFPDPDGNRWALQELPQRSEE